MRVRKIDPVKGRQFGQGLLSFWVNVPDGPGQCVKTRLGLWTGQWWLDLPDGTNWPIKVLGKYTGSTRDVEVQQRILGTPGVLDIAAYSSEFDPNARTWKVNATLDTLYGQIKISGPI